MKKILGLDLGVSSIGWALVNEAESSEEQSNIIRLGVRVNPLTTDEETNFEQGKPITTTADRTLKRTARRNLQRYKLRRNALINLLKEHHFITDSDILSENGIKTTFETLHLRAKAATEHVELAELSRVLLAINKKRGYKSSRKANSAEEGEIIDSMGITREMYDNGYTPGQYVYTRLVEGKKSIPTFYRSDLIEEFNKIFKYQQQYYPEILTNEFYDQIKGRGKNDTSKRFLAIKKIYLAENKGKDSRLQAYRWRNDALSIQLKIDEVAYALCEINGNIAASSGYLSDIGDRSKELTMSGLTVGEYMAKRVDKDCHYSFRNEVFYRTDYMDEFERIWECQAQYHHELTPELKREIRDIVIFYQRNLKSQKGLINLCEFERFTTEITDSEGNVRSKVVGHRVAPRSSFIFQEFKIWQILNNIIVSPEGTKAKKSIKAPTLFDNEGTVVTSRNLTLSERQRLFDELWYRSEMKSDEVIKLLFNGDKNLTLNFEKIEGNKTMAALMDRIIGIIELSGHTAPNIKKQGATRCIEDIKEILRALNFNANMLDYCATLNKKDYEAQTVFKLWHLLYSFESDNTPTGDGRLIERIKALTGFDDTYARELSKAKFQDDYGSLSERAMRRILTFMRQGYEYSEACEKAGYRHSARSLTREELNTRQYADHLDILPKNSLRNPVVEKIINQMVHVVNGIIAQYGKPDEIRIELARELKQSAVERDKTKKSIDENTRDNERIKQILQSELHLSYVSRNDIIRYRLYEELKDNGYHTLYSDKYIPIEKLFSKEIDIEHIIPQAKLFDDSFSNKTLEYRNENIEKSNKTAYDYVAEKYGDEGIERYKTKITGLKSLSPAKRKKLMMRETDIPKDFINRDLRDSQYIAKKAREILEQLVPRVISTTGSITSELRQQWQLVNTMQELNWDKYSRIDGMTYIETNRDGQNIRRIKDWTKRNDHRHHAMDALTIAFTKESFIQYFNNVNARSDHSSSIHGIQQKEMERVDGKLQFKAPMPINEFRTEARRHLENILISNKAKNKVVTKNTNITKVKGSTNRVTQLTPRGRLHQETVYGKIQVYEKTLVKVNAKFDANAIALVANSQYRQLLSDRLSAFNNNPTLAFSGSNALSKRPIYIDDDQKHTVPEKVECVKLVERYTIRKPISKDLKIDQVVDSGIRRILRSRLDQYGSADKAFANLDQNPIWLNKEKGIAIKTVTIFAPVDNLIALHSKRDKDGHMMTDIEGHPIGTDFVKPGNNHHVAIFVDTEGNYQEHIVTMYEASQRAIAGLPIIDRNYNSAIGWQFLFTMKQNEYFVFPRYETRNDDTDNQTEVCTFDPSAIDLKDPANYATISPNLFRVQKMSSKDYYFRHHLETTVDSQLDLQGITWKRISSLNKLKGAIKVRVNHIGEIVDIGEY